MVVVYFVICAVGYVAGAYGRVHFFNDGAGGFGGEARARSSAQEEVIASAPARPNHP